MFGRVPASRPLQYLAKPWIVYALYGSCLLVANEGGSFHSPENPENLGQPSLYLKVAPGVVNQLGTFRGSQVFSPLNFFSSLQ